MIVEILSQRTEIKRVTTIGTKIRAYYKDNLFIDVYWSKSGRYDVALIYDNRRILCWDNAPHHREVSTFPHHRHEFNRIYDSDVEDADKDLGKILDYIKNFIEKEKLL
ncbi:MAG TPA: hypothetical protein EYP30_05660 [Archaeoglobaceae archaeon]|nr:hypothetical protein [Archaeoglobaceae archaeon]